MPLHGQSESLRTIDHEALDQPIVRDGFHGDTVRPVA